MSYINISSFKENIKFESILEVDVFKDYSVKIRGSFNIPIFCIISAVLNQKFSCSVVYFITVLIY